MNLDEKLAQGFVFCDGGTGTVLQAEGLGAGERPELWNLLHPDRVTALHLGYLRAGADVIVTNTFGANRLAYPAGGPNRLEDVVAAGVRCAREAAASFRREAPERDVFVSLDIGPTGRLLEPVGDLPFGEAVSLFGEIVRLGAAAGADMISIETMGDSLETKAAVLAARENSALPIFATNAYNAAGRLLSGSTPEVMAALLQGLGVRAFGLNCGLGPREMLPLVKRLCAAAYIPVIANPNAGLPEVRDGRTVFPVGPADFAAAMADVIAAGARVIGGCCGTGFEHIARLRETAASAALPGLGACGGPVAASRTTAVRIGAETTVSSAADASLHREIAVAMRDDDGDAPFEAAMDAVDDGADLICVCAPEGPEEGVMLAATAEYLQTMISAPLLLRASRPELLADAVRSFNGVPALGLTDSAPEKLDALCALAAGYGCPVAAGPEALDGVRAAARRAGLRPQNVFLLPELV